jgi:hypothetical protein
VKLRGYGSDDGLPVPAVREFPTTVARRRALRGCTSTRCSTLVGACAVGVEPVHACVAPQRTKRKRSSLRPDGCCPRLSLLSLPDC